MRRVAISIIACLVAFIAFTAESCDAPTNIASKQRRESVKQRANTFARAQAKYPLPHTENFPLRKMLVEMTKREDLDNHPWYVYVLADTGNVIGYYVAKTVPINACDFLGSTEDVHTYGEYGGSQVLKAPSLDGIYYGASSCDVFIFQDYSTNAIIKLGSVKYFVADKPLNIDAEAINVKH